MVSSWARAIPFLAALLLAGATLGCDSGDNEPPPDRPDPRVCAANWRVVFSPEQEALATFPKDLAWSGGRLYLNDEVALHPKIRSVPATGGEATVLFTGSSRRLWIEDDQLVFMTDLDLYRMPLAGGAPQALYHAPFRDNENIELVEAFALDRQALFWAQQTFLGPGRGEEWSVWRAARDGRGERSLAVLPTPEHTGLVLDIVPTDDSLIVSAQGGLWKVPKTGGEARPHPSFKPAGTADTNVVGLGGDGSVIWRVNDGGFDGEKGSDHYSLRRASFDDDHAAPFWATKPPPAYPLNVWPRGDGSWYVAAWEWGTDDLTHMVLWTVDAQGRGTRLACDPEVDGRIEGAALAPDGLYLLVSDTSLYWQVVAVRPPS